MLEKIPRREAGLSLVSWLFIILLVALLAFAAFRIVPAYIECAKLNSILNAMRTDARTKSIPELRTELSNQLMINSLDNVDLNDFRFAREGDQLTISIDEPIERPWIANLGFILHCRCSVTVTRGNGD